MNKADLGKLLTGGNADILKKLPEVANDTVDDFVRRFVAQMAYAIRGCGLPAIDAKVKLEAMLGLNYADLRKAVLASPEYRIFLEERTDEEKAASAKRCNDRRLYYCRLHHEKRLKDLRALEVHGFLDKELMRQSVFCLANPANLSGVELSDIEYLAELDAYAATRPGLAA